MQDQKLSEVVFFLMERAMRLAKDKTKAIFKREKYGVTIDQWIILKRISEVEEISQVEIANTTFKDPAAVTRMLDILVRKKLVERQANPDDRRAYMISLTKSGKALVNKMTPKVQEIRNFSLQTFTEEERNQLKYLLNKLYDNMDDFG